MVPKRPSSATTLILVLNATSNAKSGLTLTPGGQSCGRTPHVSPMPDEGCSAFLGSSLSYFGSGFDSRSSAVNLVENFFASSKIGAEFISTTRPVLVRTRAMYAMEA